MRRFGLDDDSVRESDCVGRAGRLAHACWSDRENEQSTGREADRVQVIGVIPEELVDLEVRQKSGIWCDRTRAVEVKDLQAASSTPVGTANCQEFAGG